MKNSKYKFLVIGICVILVICSTLILSTGILKYSPHVLPDATDISSSNANSSKQDTDISSNLPAGNELQHLKIPQKLYDKITESPEYLVILIPEDIRANTVTELSGNDLLRIVCRVIQISSTSVPEHFLSADGSGYNIPLSDITSILNHILLNYHIEYLLKSPLYNHEDQTIYINSSLFTECSDKLETLEPNVIKRVPYDGNLTAEFVLEANSMKYHGEKVFELEVLVSNSETTYTYKRAEQIVIVDKIPKVASIVTIQN